MNNINKLYLLLLATLIFSCKSKDKEIAEPEPKESDFSNPDTLLAWEGGNNYYKKWANGPSADTSFFPVAVWLQEPTKTSEAEKIKAMYVNTYIGLFNGPTEAQLKGISDNNLYTICTQNTTALSYSNKEIIKGWMHVNEPDQSQAGVVVLPAEARQRFVDMKQQDNTRPVYINFGPGAVSDHAYGRGVRNGHPEDYPEYTTAADILSFGVYPMNTRETVSTDADSKKLYHDDVAQKPWIITNGIDRLRAWSEYKKPVWTWIECTNITNVVTTFSLTPRITKAEVWLALTHGARGIGYFIHKLQPAPVVQAGVLQDAAMVAAITNINREITELAPVLNKPGIANAGSVISSDTEIGIHYMVKRHHNATYLFAVSDKPGTTQVTIKLKGFKADKVVQVYGEGRTIPSVKGEFTDEFSNYAVHIYKIPHN